MMHARSIIGIMDEMIFHICHYMLYKVCVPRGFNVPRILYGDSAGMTMGKLASKMTIRVMAQ